MFSWEWNRFPFFFPSQLFAFLVSFPLPHPPPLFFYYFNLDIFFFFANDFEIFSFPCLGDYNFFIPRFLIKILSSGVDALISHSFKKNCWVSKRTERFYWINISSRLQSKARLSNLKGQRSLSWRLNFEGYLAIRNFCRQCVFLIYYY